MYALADCNNFFVSCERVFRPELNGKPVIVLSNNDGCAVARSNEAKALGIKMGDPLFKIRDIVERNHVHVFSGNFALYGDMSRRVQEVLMNYSPSIEIYSIDEAFLDLDGMDVDFDKYTKEITSLQELSEQVANFAEGAVTKLRAQHSIAREMVVFAITNRFKQDAPQTYASKYVVIPDGTADHRTFIRHAMEGCRDFYRPGYGYKKAGVVITKLVQEEGFSHSLFSDMAALEKESKLSESIDSIHKAFGRGAVLLGSQGNGEIKMSREHQSPHYTPLWSDIPKTTVR